MNTGTELLLIVGAQKDDNWRDWLPALPDDIDEPAMVEDDEYIGVVVAAFPPSVADKYNCGVLKAGCLIEAKEDVIREWFDGEAGAAQERWHQFFDSHSDNKPRPPRDGSVFIVIPHPNPMK